MRKKPFFIESKLETFPFATCKKCLRLILAVADGKTFFNPNKNALHRRICRECYESHVNKRRSGLKIKQALERMSVPEEYLDIILDARRRWCD
jgi:hypothetical protein